MSSSKKFGKGLFNWTFLGIIAGAIIIINIIASLLYVRLDMTEDNRYSLSNGTISFLEDTKKLSSRVHLKIYLEGNLPAEIKHFRNALEDKLKEFKQYTGNRLEYEFIDPNIGTDNEKQVLFESLYARGKGIIPMDLVYMQEGSQSKMMLWPGATIDVGGMTVQSIQFLPGTPPGKPYFMDNITEMVENSINNLEYMLISSLRRATENYPMQKHSVHAL
jgi:ABC-2 type transport system permease protein